MDVLYCLYILGESICEHTILVTHIKPYVGMDNNHGWFIWILQELP